MGRTASVTESDTLHPFTHQLSHHLSRQGYQLNTTRACLDLLEPVLRTLQQLTPEPWEELPKQLPGQDDPYVEMLYELHRLWKERIGRPLSFTEHGPHHQGRRYELLHPQEVNFVVGNYVAIEHLLHWRLSKRDKRNRRFSRLALLTFQLLERILTHKLRQDAIEVNLHDRAHAEYFEYVSETNTTGHSYVNRPLNKKELDKIFHDENAFDSNPLEAVAALSEDWHLYSKEGALAYLNKLLSRWLYRAEVIKGKTNEYTRWQRILATFSNSFELLQAQPNLTHHERSVLQAAERTLALYDEWPDQHQVYPLPTLQAFMETPGRDTEDRHVLHFYSFMFSLNDTTGRMIVEDGEAEIESGCLQEPMRIIYANPDGTLMLNSRGTVVECPELMVSKDFCTDLATAMDQLVMVEEKYAYELGLDARQAFDFTTWWPKTDLPLRKLLGKWRHTFSKAPEGAERQPATLLEILGPELDENQLELELFAL